MVFSSELFDRFRQQMLIWISPNEVEYCTPASSATDLNQHEANLDHPHSYYNRGYFFENERRGELLTGDWDLATLKFNSLLEFRAVNDHIKGTKRWSQSDFAARLAKYISYGNVVHGYNDPDKYLIERERRFDNLVKKYATEGINPVGGHNAKCAEQDDISVNITRDGKLLFNNRGHHRLSIAVVLGISKIPVQCIVMHKDFIDLNKSGENI